MSEYFNMAAGKKLRRQRESMKGQHRRESTGRREQEGEHGGRA